MASGPAGDMAAAWTTIRTGPDTAAAIASPDELLPMSAAWRDPVVGCAQLLEAVTSRATATMGTAASRNRTTMATPTSPVAPTTTACSPGLTGVGMVETSLAAHRLSVRGADARSGQASRIGIVDYRRLSSIIQITPPHWLLTREDVPMTDLTIYPNRRTCAARFGFVLDPDTPLSSSPIRTPISSARRRSWPVFGDSIRSSNTVAHIGELFHAAKLAGITVAISPHYFYPTDKQWLFGDPLEHFMSAVGMFGRQGAYTTDGFAGSGADFLPAFQRHIHDGQTVIASPHKIVGPESNDLVLQLRKRCVNQVILAGMAANCASKATCANSSSRASRWQSSRTPRRAHAYLKETAIWLRW